MWHKVSPIAFRIPYIKNWGSSWFADKKTYASYISTDNTIREVLKKELNWIPTGDIKISRKEENITIDIFTTKASLVLGKDNENLIKIENLLSKKVAWKVSINVKEIKKPELNAKVVAFSITNQIEKRTPYKKAIKQAIAKTMEKWAKWIKVKVWWRLNGAEIARVETFKEWSIPTLTIRSDIDYVSSRAETVYWTIWIKVWIYKWDIFK